MASAASETYDVDVPTQRRAVVLSAHGDPDVMQIVEEPVPSPGPGEVLITVDAVGINFGDVLLRQGRYGRAQSLSVRPGFEVAGTVAAVGSRVEGLAPGTPVAAFPDNGGYADAITVPAARVLRRADELTATQAAALLIHGLTAWFAIHRYGRVQEGDRVLVHAAAGGVGGVALQLLRRLGAIPVAVASTEDKRKTAIAHGAAVALAPEPEGLRDAIREATDGHGVDVVLDSVGGAVFEPSIRSLTVGGRYVVVGAASGEPSPLDLRRLMGTTVEVGGFVLSAMFELEPGTPPRAFAELSALLSDGHLEIPVRTLALGQVADAHRMMESRSVTGKLVLTT